MNSKRLSKILVSLLFVLYLALLTWVVIFKCAIPKEILGNECSLDPIKFGPVIQEYMDSSLKERFLFQFTHPTNAAKVIVEFVLNIVVFIPLGVIFSTLINKSKWWINLLTGLSISICVELIQLITSFGGFEIYDLIANTFGTILGGVIYSLLIKAIKEEQQIKVINITCLVSFIIFVPIFIYAIYSMVNNFEYISYRISY